MAGLAGALGLVFAGGMMIYASIYVLRIDQQGNQLVLKTIAPWGFGSLRHEIRIEALTKSRYQNGRFSVVRATGSPGRNIPLEVDAPWITVAVQGRRLPFLLDIQAEHIDSGALRKLITGAVAEWTLDRG